MQSDRFSYKNGFIVKKINAFSFLAPTTFGAEYCLIHAISHPPPTLQHSFSATAELLVAIIYSVKIELDAAE